MHQLIWKTFCHFSQQVEEEVNDPETQEDAQQVECLDMEALPSGSNQVKTTVQTKPSMQRLEML